MIFKPRVKVPEPPPDPNHFRPIYGRDDARDDQRNRIFKEITAGCYQLSEFQKAWYFYLDEYIMFPFEADIHVKTHNSGEIKVKTIAILSLIDEAYCATDILVKATTGGENEHFYLPLTDLHNIRGGESTKQPLGDCQYWRSDYIWNAKSTPQ